MIILIHAVIVFIEEETFKTTYRDFVGKIA